jgi:hypothetical protein
MRQRPVVPIIDTLMQARLKRAAERGIALFVSLQRGSDRASSTNSRLAQQEWFQYMRQQLEIPEKRTSPRILACSTSRSSTTDLPQSAASSEPDRRILF